MAKKEAGGVHEPQKQVARHLVMRWRRNEDGRLVCTWVTTKGDEETK